MKLEITSIPNVIPENIDESKLVLANNIIQNVYPLFNEVFNSKVEEIDGLKQKLHNKKNKVQENKKELEQLMDSYRKKKKVAKLLDRLEKLVSSGLVYDGSIKHETVVLLKIVHNLSEEKIDYHLRETLQTISKRFSR